MFGNLTEKLQSAFQKIRGRGHLRSSDVEAALRDIRLALLEADVHFKVVKTLLDIIRQRALGEKLLKSLKPDQQLVGMVHDALLEVLGSGDPALRFGSLPPGILLLAGLQGSGKTTTAAKLGHFFQKGGHRVLLVPADTQRLAAVEQLTRLGEKLEIEVFPSAAGLDPVDVAKRAVEFARTKGFPRVIIDSAGRLHVDEELMGQLSRIATVVKPHETLFVCDAMAGQSAVDAAKIFSQKVDLTGVILTKLDGDARGGAALSVKHVTGKPIKFVGVGEKADALEAFHPDRLARRILGMGDVLSLVEKAQQVVDEETAQKQVRKMRKGDFTLEDFKDQLEKLSHMGPLSSLMDMLPGGMGRKMGDMDMAEDRLKGIRAILSSMTPKERQKPVLINGSRRRRIAKGSGTTPGEVGRLLKQYKTMRKLMKKGPKALRHLLG